MDSKERKFEKTAEKFESARLWTVFFLLFLFAFSFLLRWVGLHNGFPMLTHPDESAIIAPVLETMHTRVYQTGNLFRPDQILINLLLLLLNTFSFIRYGMALDLLYYQDQLAVYAFARLVVAILGSLIPIVVFFIGRQFKLRGFSYVGGLIFAVFPLFVRHSQWITPDVPITLFSLLVLLFALRFVQNGKSLDLVLSVFFVAVNMAEKYPGILSMFIVLLAIALHYRLFTKDRRLKEALVRFAWVLPVFLVSLFIVAPNLFLHFGDVVKAFSYEFAQHSSHLGADGLGFWGNLWFYARLLWTNSNILILLAVFPGIAWGFYKKDPRFLLLAYGFGYWVALSMLSLHWERWSLPMMISPLLFSAAGFCFLWEKLEAHKYLRWLSPTLLLFAVFLMSIQSAYGSVRQSWKDTRVLGLEYFQQVGITPTNSVSEGYTPFNPDNATRIFTEDFRQARYVILSSNMYGRYEAEPERYREELAFYARLRQQELLLEIKPSPLETRPDRQVLVVWDYVKALLKGDEAPDDQSAGPVIQIYEYRQP